MPETYPDGGNPGTVYAYGHRITFPFGSSGTSGGGMGGPLPGDTSEIGDNPPDDEVPCRNISGLSDAQKERYLIRYLAQRIADLMANLPKQNREYGSMIYRTASGNFGYTSFVDPSTERAVLNEGDLPRNQYGHADYRRVVAVIHNHPRFNWPPGGPYLPTTPDYDWYRDYANERMIRPHLGDWATWNGIRAAATQQNNDQPGPYDSTLLNFIFGYSRDANGNGRMTLHEYSATDKPADDGDTETTNPELELLPPPCNE